MWQLLKNHPRWMKKTISVTPTVLNFEWIFHLFICFGRVLGGNFWIKFFRHVGFSVFGREIADPNYCRCLRLRGSNNAKGFCLQKMAQWLFKQPFENKDISYCLNWAVCKKVRSMLVSGVGAQLLRYWYWSGMGSCIGPKGQDLSPY